MTRVMVGKMPNRTTGWTSMTIKMSRMKIKTTMVIVLPEMSAGLSKSREDHTILLCLLRNLVQPSLRPIQPRGRPVHSCVCVFKQIMVQIQLGSNLDRQVVLPSDRI